MDLTAAAPLSVVNDAGEPGALMEMIALKRSAHHAFIDWLCGWKDRPTLFVNNVLPSDPPRFGQLTIYQGDKIDVDTLTRYREDTRNALAQNQHDTLINFEGRLIENIRKFNAIVPHYWGEKRIDCVLFLRDPLNNFSSLTKRLIKTSFNEHLKVFYQTLRFCEYMDELKGSKTGAPKLFDDVILFTAWQRDENYRRKLATKMGLTGSDLKGGVPSFGGGSSFSGVRFDPINEQQKLFSRWREMQTNPFFLSLFLSDRVFQSVEAYYDMFGDVEHEGKATVHELRMSAQANPEAIRLCRIWMQGFEKSHAIYDGLERENASIVRRFWRAYIKSKIGVRRLIYSGL